MTQRAADPAGAPLEHPLLAALGVRHGFGVRAARYPEALRRPRQVHGVAVATGVACAGEQVPEADAVVTSEPALPIAVATADCVPVLLAAAGGRTVAAIHAGWRGLARGVIEAGVAAACDEQPATARAIAAAAIVAVVGPHIGPCCYEVDAPVLDAMADRFTPQLADATEPTRPGHARLDLGKLAHAALLASGLREERIGRVAGCTACEPERFHSYRRDGARAGRLLHFIAARSAPRNAASGAE